MTKNSDYDIVVENPGFQFNNMLFSTDAMYTIVGLCEPLMVIGLSKYMCWEDPKVSQKTLISINTVIIFVFIIYIKRASCPIDFKMNT